MSGLCVQKYDTFIYMYIYLRACVYVHQSLQDFAMKNAIFALD